MTLEKMKILRVSTLRSDVDISTECEHLLSDEIKGFINQYGKGNFGSELTITDPYVCMTSLEGQEQKGVLIGSMSDGFSVLVLNKKIYVCDKRAVGEYRSFESFDALLHWILARDEFARTEVLYFDSDENVKCSWVKREVGVDAFKIFKIMEALDASLSFRSFYDHAWWWEGYGVLFVVSNVYLVPVELNLVEFCICHSRNWNFLESNIARELRRLFSEEKNDQI
jgi:hypothetical protein